MFEKLKDWSFGFFLILVIILFFGIGAAQIYYPSRLYFSGYESSGKVDSVVYGYTLDGSIFYLRYDNVSFDYHRELASINKGDSVQVFQSKVLNKGVLLAVIKNGETTYELKPTLLNIIENYNSSERRSDMIIYLIVTFFPLIIVLIFAIISAIKKIRLEIKMKKEKHSDENILIVQYISSYITPLTYIIYGYGLLFLLFKAIFFIEKDNYILSGILFYFGLIVVFYTPTFFFNIKNYFRNTKNKLIKYGVQITSVVFSLYGTINLIHFFNTYDLSSFKDHSELIKKLLSELIKT